MSQHSYSIQVVMTQKDPKNNNNQAVLKMIQNQKYSMDTVDIVHCTILIRKSTKIKI